VVLQFNKKADTEACNRPYKHCGDDLFRTIEAYASFNPKDCAQQRHSSSGDVPLLALGKPQLFELRRSINVVRLAQVRPQLGPDGR